MRSRASSALVLVAVLGCAGSREAGSSPVDRATVEPNPPQAMPEPAPPEPTPPRDPVAELLALEGSVSTSIGGPSEGRVSGAVALPDVGPGFVSNPRRPNAQAFYGTVEMVQALVEAAAVVERELPGSTLKINDLGLPEGGPIPHHGSHRAGRDVDVLFYLLDSDGQPIESVGAFLDPRGRGYDFKDLAVPDDDVLVRIDLPRTWRFIQALFEGRHGDQVQRIFVAEHLRTLLLAHAERARAPARARERFADATCQPSYPHDDHLHIRFYCTPEDIAAGCEDTAPIYPYWRDQLRAQALRPTMHRPRRERRPSPRVTTDQARAAAGEMHTRVQQWLDRREAWLEEPHPGRTYCR